MKNYVAEFHKYSSRAIKSNIPITAIGINSLLCQDIWYDLDLNFTKFHSYHFSKGFFYDLTKIRSNTDWSRVYVLDGIKHLHKTSGSTLPLVKDRTLYYLLYSPNVSPKDFIDAVRVNPWLNDIAIHATLLENKPGLVQYVAANTTYSKLLNTIIDTVPSTFTPRGAWGLDFMFLLKSNGRTEDINLKLEEDIELITLDEYLESFKGGIPLWTY